MSLLILLQKKVIELNNVFANACRLLEVNFKRTNFAARALNVNVGSNLQLSLS